MITDYSRISSSSSHAREASQDLHPAADSPLLAPVVDDESGSQPTARAEDEQDRFAGGSANIMSGVSNLANTILGTGCLAFPSAFASIGIIPGVFSCAFSGFMSFSGLYLLSRCAAHVVPRRTSSFNAISLLTFGPKATVLFDLAIAIKCFGVSISYLIIIKTLTPQALSTIYTDLFPGSTPPRILPSGSLWLLVSFAVNVPLAFLKKLDSLRFTSQAALFFVVYLLAIVIVFLFHRPHDIEPAGEIEWVRFHHDSIGSFPVQIFAYTCAQNLFPVFNELKNNTQARMNKVTVSAIGSAIGIYETIGLAGYLTFGNKVTSNILSSYPNASLFVAFGRIGITIMVLFSYPLQAHPCRASLDKIITTVTELYHPSPDSSFSDAAATNSSSSSSNQHVGQSNDDQSKPLLASVGTEDPSTGEVILEIPKVVEKVTIRPMSQTRYVVLTCLILLGGLVVAESVDDLEVVLSFVGATGSTIISFILPGLFYFKLFRHKSGENQNLVWASLGLAVYGVCVMCFCLTYNIVKLASGSKPSH